MPKHKRIFIDGLGLVDGHFSGVGQYILGILQGIDDVIDEQISKGEIPDDVRVIIPFDKQPRFQEFEFKHLRPKTVPIPFRYMAQLWHRGLMPPIDLWCGRGDYIFPRFVDMPLLFSRRVGLVIFDLSYELHREYSDEGNAKFLSKRVHESIKRFKDVITISENAKREIIEFYGFNDKHVHVATPAVNLRTLYRRSDKDIEKAKLKYGIDAKHYILALSNLEPRKNLQALVDAYCSLPEESRKNTALLLVGVSGWKADALFAEITKKVSEGYNIIRPDRYVKDEDKAAIISGATLLVYPSHYEGFGMPPLEALACGVPVITSDNSSLPEVVKGVGEMVNVTNGNHKLKRSLENALDNIDVLTQKSLAQGPERAAEFSWKKSAEIFLDLARKR